MNPRRGLFAGIRTRSHPGRRPSSPVRVYLGAWAICGAREGGWRAGEVVAFVGDGVVVVMVMVMTMMMTMTMTTTTTTMMLGLGRFDDG